MCLTVLVEMLVRLWLGYILVVLPGFRLPYIIVLVVISVALMPGTKLLCLGGGD